MKKILLFALVLIILIGGGYFVFQYGSLSQLPAEESEQRIDDPGSEVLGNSASEPYRPNLIQTNSWNTYRNEKFSFSVKYPQEFSIKEFPEDENFIGFNLPYERTVYLSIKENPGMLEPKDYFAGTNFFTQGDKYYTGNVDGSDLFILFPSQGIEPTKYAVIDAGNYFVILYDADVRKVDEIFDSLVMSFKKQTPVATMIEKGLAEQAVKDYEDALKTRQRDNVLIYVTGELEKNWQETMPFFGTSNPRPGGCEILSSEKIDDGIFKVDARSIEEYAGMGISYYRENVYTVKKIDDKYLISSIEYGELNDISASVAEFYHCPTTADCDCQWNPVIVKTYCPESYEKLSGAYYDGEKCAPVEWCTVPFPSIASCESFCVKNK